MLGVIWGCVPSARHEVPPATVPDFLGNQSPKAELLFLGVFHFADAGLDGYKPRFSIDFNSPERHRQVEEVVDRLAQFRPTKIAVEWPVKDQPRADSLYRAYVAGTYTLGTNEVYQLGFRLAKKLHHERVYLIDAPGRSYLTDESGRAEAASLGINIEETITSGSTTQRSGTIETCESSTIFSALQTPQTSASW